MTLTPRQKDRVARFTPDQIELHRMVIKHIEAEPHRWSQTNWISGPTFIKEYVTASTQYDDLERNPSSGPGEAAALWNRLMGAVYDVEQCGTTMCYAGWACHVVGDRLTVGREAKDADGNFTPISERAAELLGLNDREANDMFSPTNAFTVEDIRRVATNITGIEFD